MGGMTYRTLGTGSGSRKAGADREGAGSRDEARPGQRGWGTAGLGQLLPAKAFGVTRHHRGWGH